MILGLKIPICDTQPVIQIWKPNEFHTSNETSSVYQDQNFLIPGDSPQVQEVKWVSQIKNLDRVEYLVLGHHGSRTSTGMGLLNHLSHVKLAIASARFKKYHHPHWQTLQRLHKKKVPVLKTEDWGNIIF